MYCIIFIMILFSQINIFAEIYSHFYYNTSCVHELTTFESDTSKIYYSFDKNCFLRSIEYLLKAYLIIWLTKVVSCEFEPCWWRGVFDTTLCDKVCQWLCGFLRVLRFSPPINWPSRYNRNIVEGGIIHHNSNPIIWLNYQANLGTKSQCTVFIVLIYCIAIFYICIKFSEWVIVV